jgi:hypothetical protein
MLGKEASMVDWVGLRDSQSPRVWGEIGALGVVVFLAGVLIPIWKGVPFGFLLQDLVAAAGGGLALFGFSLAWDARQAILADPARQRLPGDAELIARVGPSVEVYRPPRRPPDATEPGGTESDSPNDDDP